MNQLRPHIIGLAFGVFLGVCHLCWAILVGIGVAQPLLDFIFKLHMLAPVFTVTTFSIGTAVALVLVTSAIGYILGLAIAVIWNWCTTRSLHR